MNPHLSTSLNDAIFVAHRDLLSRKGTKVMIIVSDGNDTGSLTPSRAILDLLGSSPVLVYTIHLKDVEGMVTEGRKGLRYLKSISKLTGSVCMPVEETQRLDKAFERIYRELKSFYLMDFYTEQEHFDNESIQVRVSKSQAKVRFKPFFGIVEKEVSSRAKQ